jgi:hypothetical protein
MAIQELGVDDPLEIGEPLADRGDRHRFMLCRLADRAMLADGHKELKRQDVDPVDE